MNNVRCPICDATMPGNWQDYPDYPFCTRRCRVIDLGRWLGEEYKVSGKDGTDDGSTPGDGGEDDTTAR